MIEGAFCRLEGIRHIASRYDKSVGSCLSTVALVTAIAFWLRSSLGPRFYLQDHIGGIEGKAVTTKSSVSWNWPALLMLLLIQLWSAHALVFFIHEYSHSFVAWMLGWKSNPLALHYPPFSILVVLIQYGINQNVNETPIFASGHGIDAGLIAAAGPILGNGMITLGLSRLAYQAAIVRHRAGWALFAYWCTVASVGNFFDYIPIRTFTLVSDMGSVQRGFNCSPWMVLAVLGPPTLIAMLWLFLSVLPQLLRQLFPASTPRQALVAVITVGAMFGFFGAAGLLEGGPVSYRLSMVSVSFILPLMIVGVLVGVGRMRTPLAVNRV
ncbi:MAG: hypothetical protein INR71_15460 [Terriglobus roseus]|nr:hypothetical protein [Terriglobus roseus]